jgi:hypothetical protein
MKKNSTNTLGVPNYSLVDQDPNSWFDLATIGMLQKTEEILINYGQMNSDLSICIKYPNKYTTMRRVTKKSTSKISILENNE